MRLTTEARVLQLEKQVKQLVEQLVELHQLLLETRQAVSPEMMREAVLAAVEMRSEEIRKLTSDCVQALGVLAQSAPEVHHRLNSVVGR